MSMLSIRPQELESAPIKKVVTEESQTTCRIEKTPQPGASRKDKEILSNGKPQQDITSASLVDVPNFNTLKANQDPQYNDIFTAVFNPKQHQAYRLREINEKRTDFIAKKFGDTWKTGNAELDKKIERELEERNKKLAEDHDARKTNR